MVKCPKCNRDTSKETGRCFYCNAELPKISIIYFLKNLLRKFSEAYKVDVLKRIEKIKEEFKNISVEGKERGFRMSVEGVFYIQGRGTVVTGKIQQGSVRVSDPVFLVSKNGQRLGCTVKWISKFRKNLQEAAVGDNIGLVLSEVSEKDIDRLK